MYAPTRTPPPVRPHPSALTVHPIGSPHPQGGYITHPTHVEDGMGVGVMRATIVVTQTSKASPEQATTPAQSPKSPSSPPPSFRVDVARFTGDTFQFHAFYRQLRELMRPLTGWVGSPQAEPPREVPPAAAARGHDAGAHPSSVVGFGVANRAGVSKPPAPTTGALASWTRRTARSSRSSGEGGGETVQLGAGASDGASGASPMLS